MASPTGATWVRVKTAPQRGQVLALAEIIAPHTRHEVILVTTFRDFLGTGPAFRCRSATNRVNRQAWLRRGQRRATAKGGFGRPFRLLDYRCPGSSGLGRPLACLPLSESQMGTKRRWRRRGPGLLVYRPLGLPPWVKDRFGSPAAARGPPAKRSLGSSCHRPLPCAAGAVRLPAVGQF
jgi:hypothetical protein